MHSSSAISKLCACCLSNLSGVCCVLANCNRELQGLARKAMSVEMSVNNNNTIQMSMLGVFHASGESANGDATFY